MELKEWLNRGWNVYRRYLVKKAHMESLFGVISNYGQKEIESTHSENMSEFNMITYSELKYECDELKFKLAKIDRETNDVIKLLENSSHYIVLYCRYVRRLTWKEIPAATNYAESTVFLLHREAIEELERLFCYKNWDEE